MSSLDGETLRQQWIEAVVEEGERVGMLAQEMAAGLSPAHQGLDVTVPWVPAWRARDLVGHLGTVHRWATAILRAGHTERPGPETEQAPPAEGLLDWYAAGLADLVTTLRTTPPDRPAWHMSPAAEKVANSWARRQAHELVVHRMDLETAAGVPHAPVDTALAEDGIDELVTVVVPRWAHTEPLLSAEITCAITAADTGREWSVRVRRGVIEVAPHRSGTEDAHLQGPATALLLRLWGRPADRVDTADSASLTVTGDPAAEAVLRGR